MGKGRFTRMPFWMPGSVGPKAGATTTRTMPALGEKAFNTCEDNALPPLSMPGLSLLASNCTSNCKAVAVLLFCKVKVLVTVCPGDPLVELRPSVGCASTGRTVPPRGQHYTEEEKQMAGQTGHGPPTGGIKLVRPGSAVATSPACGRSAVLLVRVLKKRRRIMTDPRVPRRLPYIFQCSLLEPQVSTPTVRDEPCRSAKASVYHQKGPHNPQFIAAFSCISAASSCASAAASFS